MGDAPIPAMVDPEVDVRCIVGLDSAFYVL